MVTEVPPEEHVLREAERHPDRRRPEPPVEADPGLKQAGDQRADERTEVDAQIEQREAAVASWVILLVQGAQQRRRVCFQRAGAEGDEHQADGDARQAREHRERDVAEHDHHAAIEHGAFHAEDAIGDPATQHGGEVHEAAIGADDAGRGGLGQLEPAVGQ